MTAVATRSLQPARDLGLATADVWDRLVDVAPDATFFHTRAWAESLTQTYPFLRNASRAFELADGAIAVLPLIQRSWLRGVLVSYQSVTPGVYGGPIAERPLSDDEVRAIVQAIARPGLVRLRINASPYATWRQPGHLTTQPDFTQAIDLSGGADAAFKAASDGHRRNVRRAQASGLTVRLATSAADYEAYYDVYQDSLRRWGNQALTHYPLELFLNIREHCGDSARLWLVCKDDQVIGGALNFYHNRHVVYWHGAFLESHFEFRPSNFLHSEAIRDACDGGFAWYDLNPSGGLEGVARFKQSLGARRLEYENLVLYGNPLFAAIGRFPALVHSFIGHRGLAVIATTQETFEVMMAVPC
jgi:hypothetical protein